MTFALNERFPDVVRLLQSGVIDVSETVAGTSRYAQFRDLFPLRQLALLTREEYCVGTGSKDSFCRWIERGLEPVLGRYMPGTSRGHLVYIQKDGTLYKHRRLRELSDDVALSYALAILSTIANADVRDLRWIDDDHEIYRRAGVEPRVTMGDGRKLRILGCYQPDWALPICSSEHVKHFLLALGCPPADVPRASQPIARMLMLRQVFEEATSRIPGLSTRAFMRALYEPTLGLAPTKDEPADLPDGDAAPDDLVDDDDPVASNLNTILCGPPGTGKTYATINEALRILDPAFIDKNTEDRAVLKDRFDELLAEGRIHFVTFHQSFSYEDFVEGLRAESDDDNPGSVRYVVEKGVFRTVCEDAIAQRSEESALDVSADARIWKISIDGTQKNPTRDYCFAHGEARIGWSRTGDLQHANLDDPALALGSNDRSCLDSFAHQMLAGDVVLCIGSNTEVAGVGVIDGAYRFEPVAPAGIDADCRHVLPVRWLVTNCNFSILRLNGQKKFTLKTVYEMTRFSWPELLIEMQAANVELPKSARRAVSDAKKKPYLLIIDEINRGNISKIFGELITLIEPSKRHGATEALEVVLPYSKKRFSVPDNVYLIGTMNTADRSLSGLDIALRRRFHFRSMPPRTDLLSKVIVDGIPVGGLLEQMNRRIEVLLDADHCLGHAYFMPLAAKNADIARLAEIFRRQILPLLQEYFFEDAQRIGWVLNDHRAPKDVERFLRGPDDRNARAAGLDLETLFGAEVGATLNDSRWSLNDKAFLQRASYLNIIGAPDA